ncbi:HIT domain-containing protein [Herbihabitans rhizosphaerae]|uniref:HIT domain-containing protein n=1 Tax=Herbihabitans rhizosphaerae TaxID=1872711 RepID=A0A4Q7KC45_9PSEU|nr:HIT family protein [Herbihabitans rhizosphaerae]RZS29764.1 HIT domain-containing protein [Herbihabitans rhizosphaerae]
MHQACVFCEIEAGTDLRCEGVRLSLADGAAAGQDVFHVHLHVIPRFRGDTRTGRRATRAALDEVAGKVRRAQP